MAIELTPQEKIDIVNQHLKNIAFNEYNLTLSIEETKILNDPNQNNLNVLNGQMEKLQSQKEILQKELDSLNAQISTNN